MMPLFVQVIYEQVLSGGFDYKDFKNYQLSQTTSNDKLRDFYITLGGNLSDRFLGRNFFDLRLQRGISESDPNRPLISRAEGRGNVFVASANITRYQSTNFKNSYFILKASSQAAGDRVLSPDQFSVGGMGTVRGFPLSEHSGDNGYFTSVEYVLPFPYKLPLKTKNLSLDQVLSFTGFLDYGEVFVRDKQAGEEDKSISGYGFGIQVNIPKLGEKKWIPTGSFSVVYARPLTGPSTSDGSDHTWYVTGRISF